VQSNRQKRLVWFVYFYNAEVFTLHFASFLWLLHSKSADGRANINSPGLQHSTAQHSTAQHSTAQHSTAQHSTAQHSTAQCSTACCTACCKACGKACLHADRYSMRVSATEQATGAVLPARRLYCSPQSGCLQNHCVSFWWHQDQQPQWNTGLKSMLCPACRSPSQALHTCIGQCGVNMLHCRSTVQHPLEVLWPVNPVWPSLL